MTTIPVAQRLYKPYGAARAMLYSSADEILMDGPAGTGKTRAVLEKVYIVAREVPGVRILLVRKTRESMTESVLVTWEQKVIPEGHAILDGAQRRMRQAYSFPNGSEVVVGGMDKPSKIMSTEYDIICMFEATECTENDLESLTTRLRNGVLAYQQIIAECNPAGPTHWLIRRAYDGKMVRFPSRHEDNPTVDETYLNRLERLSGARYARLRQGKWAASEGAVYDRYDAAIHVVKPFDLPTNWRRIRAVDFGYTNPFVCQWWAFDDDGRMYLYREIYRCQTLVEDHAKQIVALSRGHRYEATVCDHDAEGRAQLHRAGIDTVPARKPIEAGIQAVQDRLVPAGDGKPRLYIFADAVVERDRELQDQKLPQSTEEEFDIYEWAPPPTKEDRNLKEVPRDQYNHGMDALRYAVMYEDGGGHPGEFGSRRIERSPNKYWRIYGR